MWRLTSLALLTLLLCVSAFGQTSTTVSGTITDTPDGQAWFNGTYSFVFRTSPSNPTGQYFWNGIPFSTSQTFAGALDGTGHYSVSIPSNTSITPAGSTWDLTVCPLATSVCFTVNSIPVTGPTQTVSPIPPSIRINMGSPPPNTRAYTDAEMVAGALGQTYYNIIDATPHYCATFPCGWQVLKGLINVTVAPTGACTPGSPPEQVISTGVIYTCQGGTWAAVASSAAAASPVNVFQKNIGGVLGASNCLESGSVLNCLDDPHFRGPNLGVDVTVSPFNVRAVNPNTIPTPTATITTGTNSAVVSANTGLQIGDGFSIVGAGATQSMTTPIAPTVTPVCAAGPLGSGFVVAAGAGATTRSWQIAMRDVGQGLTAASSAGVTTTGNATPGAHSQAITSIASGVANTFTATIADSSELAVGCMVIINGTTNDAEFGGWKIVASKPDGTHITFTSGVNAAINITPTTATGGNIRYFLGDHLALPTPGAGGLQYEFYLGGTKVGESLIANLGYTDTTYNTWDYWGSTISGGFSNNWWAPTTAPVSPVNDTLVTTITNIVGTTLTLADNASTSVTTATSRFDNTPGIKAAIAAVNSSSITGAGGTIRFPVVVENSGTANYCYETSTFLDATGVNAVIQDGTVCLGDTLKFNGTWTGTELSAKRMLLPTFGLRSHIPIFVFGANPGIWMTGGGLNKVYVDVFGNGEVGVFNANTNGAQIFEDDSFASGSVNDYLNILFYDYQSSASGGFGMKIRNSSFVADGQLGGGQAQVGQTATPVCISKFNTLLNFDYISGSTRGFSITPHSSGLSGRFIMGEEFQGNIMPIVSFQPYYAGNTGGFYTLMDMFNDTGPAPQVAYFPTPTATLGATIEIDGANLPSSAEPLVSGAPFSSLILKNINATSALQLGQNMNTTSIGQSNGSLPGIRTASLALAAINYIGNHTLTKAEGIVNAQATLTFTVDTTLGDGQAWDVYSETGTTTLTVSAGTLHGNAATGPITIPNNSGMHVFLKGGNAYAYGLGGGGGGGGCTPGGITDALLYNGGAGTCAGVNSPTANGNYNVHYRVTGAAAVPPAIDLPGIPINVQTGTTYTIGTANTDFDRGYLITANNAGAQTYTFVNPSTTGYGFNHFFVIKNIGTGTVTASASGFTINGAASLLIAPSWTVFFWSDGVNYFASRLPDFTAFPNCVGGGNALQFTTATGVFSCGASSAGVSSITGDGIVISNSGSTGAVTLTLASAAAHKFLMNNTAGSAAPGYQSPGKADLLGTIVYNDQANTYGAFNQDFSATTIKMPTAAGFTSSATSTCGYDSTAKITHCYTNNADADVAATTSTSTTVTQVLHATAIAGIYSPSAIALADLPAPSFPLTVAGTVTSGGIPCFTSTTQESSSALMTVNVYMKGGGAGVCPSPGLTTDDGTTSTYTGTGGTKSPAFTSTGTTSGFMDYPQGTTSSGVAPCNTATSICEQAPTSVTSYLITKPGAAPVNNNSAALTSTAGVQNFAKMPQTAFLTSNYTNATTTFSNVTNLSFSVEANTNYKLTCDLDYQGSASTTGIKIQWTGPASPTAVTYDLVDYSGAAAANDVVATAFSTSLSGANLVSTGVNFVFSSHMTLINGVNAGTVQLQAAATGAGTLTVIPGSCTLQ